MNIISLEIEHRDTLRQLAANVGIDLNPHEITLGMNKRPKVLHKAFRNRSVYYVKEFMGKSGESGLAFSFHTKRGGGRTESWNTITGHPDFPIDRPAAHKILYRPKQSPRTRPQGKQEEKRQETFEAFKKAYDSARPAPADFPFLVAKNISLEALPIEVKTLSNREVFGPPSYAKPYLCIKVVGKKGEYIGFQRIYADGSRKFTSTCEGITYSGGYALIGRPEENGTIYVAESFSTAASIYQSTGTPVAIVFSEGNLIEGISVLKEAHRGSRLVIAADWDSRPDGGNIGVFSALKAGKLHRCPIVLPSTEPGKQVDFNDVYLEEGKNAVQDKLTKKANRLPIPQDRLGYLFSLLDHAPKNRINEIARSIADVSMLGDKISVKELTKLICKTAGSRATSAEIFTLLASHLDQKIRRLATHSAIQKDSVDHQETFEVEFDEQGLPHIPEIVSERLKHHLGKFRLCLLQSPTGTGKTQTVLKPLADDREKAIIASPRIGLARSNSVLFGAEYYSDIQPGSSEELTKISLCSQSFGSKRFHEGTQNKLLELDTLIVDEADQAISQLFTLGSATDRSANFVAFRECVNEIENVVLADAYMNENTVAQLRTIAPEAEIVHLNVTLPKNSMHRKETVLTDRPESVVAELIQTLNRNENAMLLSDSRAAILKTERLIKEACPFARGLTIVDNPSPDQVAQIQRFFKNPSAEVENYDYILSSPKMIAGHSIEVEHFHQHYGIFNGVITPTLVAQMLERDRTARTFLIAVPNQNTCRKSGPSSKTLRSLKLHISDYAECVLRNYQNEIEARRDYKPAILFALRQAGHRTSVADDAVFNVSKATRKRWRELSQQISDEEIERILSHPEYSSEVIRAISRKDIKDSSDMEILSSNRIRQELLKEPERDDVIFMKAGGLEKLRHLECLAAPWEKLEAYDAAEKNHLDVIDRYHARKRRKFLEGLFSRLGLDRGLHHRICQRRAQNALFFCESYWNEMCLLFPNLEDIRERKFKYPMPLIKRVLAELGLDLVSGRSNGDSYYCVEYGFALRIGGYLQRRQQRKIAFLS